MVVGVFVMMLTISGWLTLIAVGVLPVSMILIMLVMKKSQKHFRQNAKVTGALNGHVEEMFGGHKVIKAYSHEKTAIKEFDEINQNLYKAGWKSTFLSGMMFPIMNFGNNISYVLISVVGMILVTKGSLAPGDVLAFVQYANQFGQPLAQMAQISNIIQSTVAASERVFDLLDSEEEIPDAETAAVIDKVDGAVTFENVQFSYLPDVPLITDMNITVPKGKLVAIVGPTGAGKTTIVNLLMRFYELQGGAIKIDGVDIRDMRRDDLRRNIGMVLQDTWLYSDTVASNISYGKPDASGEEIKDAAWAAEAHRFIKKLPEQYQTLINEEATNISQGQKQLLTIARALLTDPAIMILDEATSSVDTITEIHIQSAMKELLKDRTSFVIAHRLSTIKNADIILVMDRGDIVEHGNHDALMAAGGFYAELYNSQFES